MNNLELFLQKTLHDANEDRPVSAWGKRLQVAFTFGYVDSQFMRYMHETFGMHVADQVVKIRATPELAHLDIPWLGLKHEFLCMGMAESSIDSMLAEAREFEKKGLVP